MTAAVDSTTPVATENSTTNTHTTTTTDEPTKPTKLEVISIEGVKVDEEVAKKVMKQLEYYFGDRNLPQDRFMLREVAVDNGWIALDTMLNFKRLANICNDKAQIAKIVTDGNSDLLQLNEEKNKIRRNPEKPLPKGTEAEKNSSNAKTVYVKGLAADMTIDEAEQWFEAHGAMAYIKMRKDAENKFKGSVFAEFSNQSDCDAFLAKGELKSGEEVVTKMLRSDYYKEKNQKMKDTKNEKRSAQLGDAATTPVEVENVEYEKGLVLRVDGLEGTELTREQFKDLFEGKGLEWVTFNKGDPKANLRFAKSATEALESVKVDGKFIVSEKELTVTLIEGDEEEAYWKESARAKAEFFQRKRKGDGGRGGRQRGGFRAKRGRRD